MQKFIQSRIHHTRNHNESHAFETSFLCFLSGKKPRLCWVDTVELRSLLQYVNELCVVQQWCNFKGIEEWWSREFVVWNVRRTFTWSAWHCISYWQVNKGRQEPEKAYSSRKMCLKLKDASISIKRVLGQGQVWLACDPCTALHVSFVTPCRASQSQVQGPGHLAALDESWSDF